MKTYQIVDDRDVARYIVKGKQTLHSISGSKSYHRSSHMFIEVFGGKFIIQKKSASTENGGLWSSSVSGHVEIGESYASAAVREAAEELGITVEYNEVEKILKIDPQHYHETNREFVTLFTYLLDPRKEHITINRKELDGIAVIPLAILEKDINVNKSRYSPVFALLFDMFLSLKRSINNG